MVRLVVLVRSSLSLLKAVISGLEVQGYLEAREGHIWGSRFTVKDPEMNMLELHSVEPIKAKLGV